MIGQTVSHYKVLERLGQGGMGEVYLAEDTSLDRKVALKFLPPRLRDDEIAHRRFLREAKSAAGLDHPYICNIYEVSQTGDGKDFICMEYVEGLTLQDKLADGPLPLKEALRIATEVAEALEEAHERGIVHRDIKPSNIMLTSKGHAKIMDFGLAKKVVREDGTEQDISSALTREGATLGTLAYMSPEQLKGIPVDHRSDIFSFGIVLYEMLTGVHPFRKARQVETTAAILQTEPAPLKRYIDDVLELLEHTVKKILANDPDKRYQSVHEVGTNLTEVLGELGTVHEKSGFKVKHVVAERGPRANLFLWFVIVMLAGAVLAIAGWSVWRQSRYNWARQEVLPEIAAQVEQQDYFAAYQLGNQIEQVIPSDSQFQALREKYSVPVTFETQPAGAMIYFKPYLQPESEWMPLGQSPLRQVLLPIGNFRWRLEKEGYDALEVSASTYPTSEWEFKLDEAGTRPLGMARVPWPQEGDFWIDKYEVTNSEFKKFVDAGGYRNRDYWKHEFTGEDRTLTWEEAMALFRDTSGMPGPFTWILGSYPEDRADDPVSGVSWYEATAFSEFVGKDLPTYGHWRRAREVELYLDILELSNFSDRGVVPVGTLAGLGRYGTYDMAGNVREWCWNRSGNRRLVVGGAWKDPPRLFLSSDVLSPLDRSPSNGFRCVKYIQSPSENLTRAITKLKPGRDYSKETPVPDGKFGEFRRFYDYDPSSLDSKIDSVDDDSPYWRKELVSFNAAYGDERVTAWLFLPKNASPPFQVVIYFPPSMAFKRRTMLEVELRRFDFVIRGGRALIHPIYKATYERQLPDYSNLGPNAKREVVIQQFKDFARSIDYLETRPDINTDSLGYFGSSIGASYGPVFCTLDLRPKAMILLGGGLLLDRPLPEIDPFHFCGRCQTPALMINGEYDNYFLLDSSQKPMFHLLAAPLEDKRHALFEAGHFPDRLDVTREAIAWLDRYLGPVK